jgi:hypothetical protein
MNYFSLLILSLISSTDLKYPFYNAAANATPKDVESLILDLVSFFWITSD